jgi:hypothetical protein
MGSKFQFRDDMGSGFEASVESGSIDYWLGLIIRAVVRLGKPIELFRPDLRSYQLTAE